MNSIKTLLSTIYLLGLPFTAFSVSYNVMDYGAIGNGITDDTKAIQQVIDECSKTGGTIVFPKGTYATGTIHLKSNIAIHLTQEAVWQAINDSSKFPYNKVSAKSRMDKKPWRSFIIADQQENIHIYGRGKIYGGGDYPIFDNQLMNSPDRPYGIFIVNSQRITIEDITLESSAHWMMRLLLCEHVVIRGINIFNHSNLNNDGIDIDGCKFVRISDCHIDTSDDALVFKSESLGICSDVVVNSCVLSSHASALKWGTASIGGFERFTVSNCVIRPSMADVIHHPFQLPGGISGIDMGNVDGGIMKDIIISNITIDGSETPIFIRMGDRDDRLHEEFDTHTWPETSDIILSNIIIRNAGKIASSIIGIPGRRIKNIHFNNIFMHILGGGLNSDTILNVSENTQGYPVNRMFGSNLPSYGFYVRHVDNVTFNNVQIFLEDEDARSAFVFDNVEGLLLKDFSMNHTNNNSPAIQLINTSKVRIHGDNSFDHIQKLIRVSGNKSQDIMLWNNRLFSPDEIAPPENFVGKSIVDGYAKVELKWGLSHTDKTGLNKFVVYKNGNKMAKVRGDTYVDHYVKGKHSIRYSVSRLNAAGLESSKSHVQIKPKSDKEPPFVKEVNVINSQQISLVFNEKLSESSAKDITNYTISDCPIENVELSECFEKVLLTTSPLVRGKAYTLTVKNVSDISDNKNIIINNHYSFVDLPVVAYWDMDSTENGGYVDGVSGAVAENRNAVTTRGVKGNAVYLSGNDSYLFVTDACLYNLEGASSISVWIRPDDPDSRVYSRIVSKKAQWNQPEGYELEYFGRGNRLTFSGASVDGLGQGNIETILGNGWVHVVAVFSNGTTKFFIDGKFAGEDIYSVAPKANDIPLHIGAAPDSKDFFKGAIDELYLFNRALSVDEVVSLYNKQY